MLSSKAVESKSHLVKQVFAAIIQDRPLKATKRKGKNNNPWTTSSVSEVLRTIPRYLFSSPRSIGCQKGSRNRSPLKQRTFDQESFIYRNGFLVLGPGDYRDPHKVRLGLRKAHEFYDWVEKAFGFVHNEHTCKEMAIVLAKGCLLSMNPFWGFLDRASRMGLLSTKSMTCIMKVLGEEGLADEAVDAFHTMRTFPGCRPDACAYNTVISALCRVGNFKKAKFLFSRMDLPLFICPPDKFTYTILITFCCKHAMDVAGCTKAVGRRIWEANHLFRLMLSNGFSPDVVTYNCLINACCKTNRIDRALELFEDMAKRGCLPNRVTYDSFIRYFSAVNEIDKAIEMLRRMEELNHGKATTTSYTPIIHALCLGGRVAEAWQYLVELVERGFIPREYTYNLVCDALKSSPEISLLDRELCEKIQEGIASRIRQVMKVKPILRR